MVLVLYYLHIFDQKHDLYYYYLIMLKFDHELYL